jgi:hypothetical protein
VDGGSADAVADFRGMAAGFEREAGLGFWVGQGWKGERTRDIGGVGFGTAPGLLVAAVRALLRECNGVGRVIAGREAVSGGEI